MKYNRMLLLLLACLCATCTATTLKASEISYSPEENHKFIIDATHSGEISAFVKNRSVIYINNQDYMDIDLDSYINKDTNEYLIPFNPHRFVGESYYPLSPKKNLIVILGVKPGASGDGYFEITIDLAQKTISRSEITNNQFFVKISGITWISNSVILMRGLPNDRVFSLQNHELNHELINEYGLAWDKQDDNYASIYGKLGYNWRGRKNSPDFMQIPDILFRNAHPQQALSEAIKYNSRFVYPLETQSFPGNLNYPNLAVITNIKPDKEHPNRVDYSKYPSQVREEGMFLAQRHVFSKPVFIGDSTWMGCLEQIYDLKGFKPTACSIILIDAHGVDSLPPKDGEVKILKYPMDILVPQNPKEYLGMALGLTSKWNASAQKLEIWQGDVAKIYDISVAFIKGADQTPTPFLNAPTFYLKDQPYAPLMAQDKALDMGDEPEK